MKVLLVGFVVIGMVFAPVVGAQEAGWQAAHEVAMRHHITALNQVLVQRRISAVEVAKAAASAEAAHAVMAREGQTALAQAYMTKALENGLPPVDKAGLGEVWDHLAARGMSHKLSRKGFVDGMSRLYEKSTPETVEGLRAEGGLERVLKSSVDRLNSTAAHLQATSYSPLERQRGHLQRAEGEGGCGLMEAELGVVAAILVRSFSVYADAIAAFVALAALICELDNGSGAGVSFDGCPECTAGLAWLPKAG